MQEYLDFCELYNKNVRARKGSDEKLRDLKDTIHTCIDNGILKDFLEHHKKEIETMLMAVFPLEQALEFVLLNEYNKGVTVRATGLSGSSYFTIALFSQIIFPLILQACSSYQPLQ